MELRRLRWKARNILGSFGGIGLIGTTLYNVLDRLVEMYGWGSGVAGILPGEVTLTPAELCRLFIRALRPGTPALLFRRNP